MSNQASSLATQRLTSAVDMTACTIEPGVRAVSVIKLGNYIDLCRPQVELNSAKL